MIQRPDRFVCPMTLGAVFTILSMSVSSIFGQPPEKVPYSSRFHEQVFRKHVQPVWMPDDAGIWYVVQTGPQQFEYGSVLREDGVKHTSTDPEKLGDQISRSVRTSEQQLTSTRRSRNGGPACQMVVENQLQEEIKIAWLNSSGDEVNYSTIAPGGSFHQHTYQGHLWQVRDGSGNVLARFHSAIFPQTIVVDGPSQPVVQHSQRRERQPQNLSPDGLWKAEFSQNSLTITPQKTPNTHVVLTPDLQQDFRLTGEVNWSPDSQSFVISACREVSTRKLQIIKTSPENQLQPELLKVPYVKPGDPLPDPVLVLIRKTNGVWESQTIENSLFPTPYITEDNLRVRWSRHGKEFFFDYNQRGHQVYRVLAVNAESGAVRVVAEESSKTFIDYHLSTWRQWINADGELLWLSERDGWNHLWKLDVSGKTAPLQLTQGNWVVRRVLHIDEGLKSVWFTANGIRPDEDPYHVHLCKVNFDGTGFQQLTSGNGTHEIELSPHKKLFLATWSRVDQAPVTELRDMQDGALICEIETSDISLFKENHGVLPERFSTTGRDGKTPIWGVLYRPTFMDPQQKYPVVEKIYAGPHAAYAQTQFGDGVQCQDLADLGFIVVQIDGMGTNFRGKNFHNVAWKNLKDAGFPDRIKWIQSAAESRPWMDLSRVGIFGGSAGGQTAMRALLDHHDFYQVAVADCGCHDNRMDKIWWNEQWMGWPVDDSYRTNSNVEDAHRLQGKLMLIVGELDTNVDPASTYQVVNALQKAGKTFDFIPVINAGHGAAETPYGNQQRLEFLIRHLQAKSNDAR